MKKFGIAIIGTGYWGVNYVRNFTEFPEIDEIVVCDKSPERLEDIRRRFPSVGLTTDVDEALSRDGIDAAIVCTPATTHFDVAQRCIGAGKHVLVEKPITTNGAQAEQLIDMASAQGTVLMVGHTFIHNPAIQSIKGYIEQGDLGRPYYLYARRTNMGPIRHDVNALWDLAPHDISIFNYLLGNAPLWVSAVGARVLMNRLEDVGFVSLSYPGGVVGHIHVSWADPYKVREIVVVGSEKRVVFDDMNALERIRIFEKGVKPATDEVSGYGEHQVQMRDGAIISPRVEASEPLKNQSRHFLTCIQENRLPLTTANDGLDVVRVMEAIDRSIARSGAPVEVESRRREATSPGLKELTRELFRAVSPSYEEASAVEATSAPHYRTETNGNGNGNGHKNGYGY